MANALGISIVFAQFGILEPVGRDLFPEAIEGYQDNLEAFEWNRLVDDFEIRFKTDEAVAETAGRQDKAGA